MKSRAAWFLLGAVLLGWPVPAGARQVVTQDFEAMQGRYSYPGPDRSRAYSREERDRFVTDARIDAMPAPIGAAARGAVSFDLQRRPGADPAQRGTVFTLTGAGGDVRTFYVQITWEMYEGRPMLHLRGNRFYEEGLGLWGDQLLLDRPVAEGQWIHLDLTWDDAARDYRLFVDGRDQDAKTYHVHPETGQRHVDPRAWSNEEGKRHKVSSPSFTSHPFSYVLQGLDTIHFGVHTEPSGEPDQATRALSNAVLDNLVITVDEIPPPGAVPTPPTTVSVAAVEHNAMEAAGFSGKLVGGDRLGVTVRGTAGAAGSFDVVHFPGLDRKIELDWRGWGVYLEEKVFYEAGEVNLRDVTEYRVYAGPKPLGAIAVDTVPLQTLEVGVQSYLLENLEVDAPAYTAVYAVMRDGTLRPVIASRENLPLIETEPGVYTGEYPVTYQDRFPRAVLVGRLTLGETSGSLAGDLASAFAMDPALTITVAAEPNVLKADEKSVSAVTAVVTDANGNPVSDHEVKFLLFTTSQYTGVVGGGAFAEQVGGTVTGTSFGKTDLFGKVSATYVAGFAAKTAIIVVRDMVSNSTGSGWVKTFINATAQLELEPVAESAAMAEGYEITVTSSDEWLTADGKSTARITARVTRAGQPVEGHSVGFSVSSGTGSIRVVKDTTDTSGEARAVYTAGKKIGMVLITATDTTAGISGSVQIELRSDAPAKIVIKLTPEKLPADGRSRADLSVLVTDINDNPNDNTEVEYGITEGSGSLRDDKSVTDRNGETRTEYVAGRTPGRVSIELTVRSPEPSMEEQLKARDLAVAVTDYKFF